MKSKEMKKIALMGITAGLLSMNSIEVHAGTDANIIDLDYIIAKPKCSAHGGCGGLTADRGINPGAYDDTDLEDIDDGSDDEAFHEDENKSKDEVKPKDENKLKTTIKKQV